MCSIGDVIILENNRCEKVHKTQSRIGYKKNRDSHVVEEILPVLVLDNEFVNGIEYFYYLSLVEYKFGTKYDEDRFIRISKDKASQLGLDKSYLLDLGIIHKTFSDYTKSGQYSACNLSKVLTRLVDYQEHKRKCEQYYLVKASVRRQIEKNKELKEDAIPIQNTFNPRNINVGDLIWVEGTILKPGNVTDKIHPAVVVSIDLDTNDFYYVLGTSSPKMSIEEYKETKEKLKLLKEKIYCPNYDVDYAKLYQLKKVTQYYPFPMDKFDSPHLYHDGFINIDNIYKKKIMVYNDAKRRYVSNFTKIGEVKPDYLLSLYKEITYFQEVINKRTAEVDEFYEMIKKEIIDRLNNKRQERGYVKKLD